MGEQKIKQDRIQIGENIRRLRLKIEDNVQNPVYITTVWGYGYKWGFRPGLRAHCPGRRGAGRAERRVQAFSRKVKTLAQGGIHFRRASKKERAPAERSSVGRR